MESEIKVEQTGTVQGYEDRRNDYYYNGDKIGYSSYDNKQGLHIGRINGVSKAFYGKTVEQVGAKMWKYLRKNL